MLQHEGGVAEEFLFIKRKFVNFISLKKITWQRKLNFDVSWNKTFPTWRILVMFQKRTEGFSSYTHVLCTVKVFLSIKIANLLRMRVKFQLRKRCAVMLSINLLKKFPSSRIWLVSHYVHFSRMQNKYKRRKKSSRKCLQQTFCRPKLKNTEMWDTTICVREVKEEFVFAI